MNTRQRRAAERQERLRELMLIRYELYRLEARMDIDDEARKRQLAHEIPQQKGAGR